MREKCYGLIHLLFIAVVKYLDSRSIEEVQDILKQLQDDHKKEKKRKNRNNSNGYNLEKKCLIWWKILTLKKKWKKMKLMNLWKEVSNLMKDINFEEEMEEDETNESMKRSV